MTIRIRFLPLAIVAALSLGLSSRVAAQNCSGQPAANAVCVGPTSGGGGFPSFRTLIGADLAANSGGGTTNFLRADGNWAAPAGGGGVTSINAQTGALLLAIPPGMRITATSGVPVTESDVTGATALYLTPTNFSINTMIYDGTNWVPRQYTGELTYTLTAGNNPASTFYDIFEAFDSGSAAVVICTGPAWSSSVSRGSGAGTTEVFIFQGRLVNKNSITCKNGANTYTVAANQGNLRGGFATTAINGQTEDSALNRLVWDLYSPQPRPMVRVDTTDTWPWATAAYRQANGNAANQLTWFIGVAGRPVNIEAVCYAFSSNAGVAAMACGIGIDSTTVNSAQLKDDIGLSSTYNQFGAPARAKYNGFPTLGFHTGVWLEFGNTGFTFTGDNATVTKQTGIQATVFQ